MFKNITIKLSNSFASLIICNNLISKFFSVSLVFLLSFSIISTLPVTVHADGPFGTTVSGKLYSWGNTQNGLLGIENSTDSTFTDHQYPTLIPTLADKTIVKVSSAAASAIALTDTGDVYVWGDNRFGYLGLGDKTYPSGFKYEPIPVKLGISGVKDIAAGLNVNVFLKTDGTVWASGGTFAIAPELYNIPSNSGHITSLIQIPTLTNIVSVAANGEYPIALDSSGKVYMFGNGCTMYVNGTTIKNIHGDTYNITSECYYPPTSNLGDSVVPFLGPDSSTVYSTGGKAIKSIFAPHGNQAAAIDVDGDVWLWGQNTVGDQIYIDPNASLLYSAIAPTKVMTGKNVVKVAGSNCIISALTQSGDVYAWGTSCGGQFGNGLGGVSTRFGSNDPTYLVTAPLLMETGKKDIAIGDGATLLLDALGKVQSAGNIGTTQATGRNGTNNIFSNVKTDSSETTDLTNVKTLTSSWGSSFAIVSTSSSPVSGGGGSNSGGSASCTFGSSGNSNVITNICLTIAAGVLSLYAGDSNPNNDICTPANISSGDTVDTTISGQASTSVSCNSAENSIALSPLSVKSQRQTTTGVVDDIVFDDLRGLASAQYSITATVSDFTVPTTSKSISLGSNPDGVVSDTDSDKPTTQGDEGKIFAVLDPSVATITPLRSGKTIQEGIANYQKGSLSTVINTSTPVTLLSTTSLVAPGRVNLSGVNFKLRTPSLLEAGDYQGTITQTII